MDIRLCIAVSNVLISYPDSPGRLLTEATVQAEPDMTMVLNRKR